MEVIDIGLDNLEPISLNFNDDMGSSGYGESTPSVNFGTGIELLMNDKKKASTGNISIDLGELDKLENDLNDLSGVSSGGANYTTPSTPTGESKLLNGLNGLGNMFGFKSGGASASQPESYGNDSKLGSATVESIGKTSTWDGFSKMNDIPIESSSAKLSDREKRRKKRLMIKKLEEWYEKGLVKNITHFNMDSVYEEVEDEYETALEDKRKKDSIKLQGWWFMTFVNSVEYANAAFDPFGLNLDGWGEQINEDIDSYEEIFSELHDKYKGGKMAPELSLLLRLGFSAAVVNFTNKALSSATPGFNDVIKQSPELMRMFTDATVSSMSQKSQGFAMASNMMQEQKSQRPRGPPPPAPVETKNQPPMQRPGMVYTERPSNRPDINASRGAMFREEGVNMNTPYADVNAQPPRQEMRGPQNSDIDNILAGLKTRTVDIHEQTEDDSMISISSLRDAQNNSLPKRSKRKQRSDKNTISLDI